jgi:hypothetical protein
MSWFRIFAMIILTLLLLNAIGAFWNIPTEGFQDEITAYTQEINTYMTTAGDILCPVYRFLQEDLAKDKPGSEKEKKDAAELEMVKAAGGALFPCPAPEEALAVPADIDLRIQRTMDYFLKGMKSIQDKVQAALDCPPTASAKEGFEASFNYYENFQDICSPADLEARKKQQAEEAIKAAAKACIAPQDISLEQKQKLLKMRVDTLARIMTKKETATRLALTKQNFLELQSLQRRIENGDLISNCPT